MRKSVLRVRTALLALLMTSTAQTALAQTAQDETPGVTTVEDIVVTAERRAARLVDVPASISVVRAADIQEKTLISLSDLGTRTPNVLIAGSSLYPNITIRGISSPSGSFPGFAPAAVIYVDEIYQGRDRAMNLPLAGVQQVEVLRGPQGSLYGKNTIAGAMNITTQRPGPIFEAAGSLLAGNLDFRQATGTVSGPVVEDRLAMSLSGFYRRRDGFILNAFDGGKLNFNEAAGGRVRAIYNVNPEFTVDLAADHLLEKGSESLLTSDYSTLAALTFPPYSTTPTFDPRTRTQSLNSPEFARRKVHGYSVRLDYDFSGVRLTTISAIRGYTSRFGFDSDGTSLVAVRQRVDDNLDQWSHEVRLTSTHEGALQWIAGAFFYQEKQRSARTSEFLEEFPGLLIGLPAFPRGYVNTAVADAAIKETSKALFVSGTYDITPRLTLAAGGRYTFDRKRLDFSQLETVPATPSAIRRLLVIIPPRQERLSDSQPTFDVSLSYAFTRQQVGYLKFSRGYKAGGFNAVLITPPFDLTSSLGFEPEFLDNYEAGFKGRWLDGRLSLNAAAFYNAYTDKQESVTNIVTLGFAVRNAARARIYGAELEAEAQPLEGLTLSGALGLLDGKYESFPNGGPGGLNFDGNRLARAPKWQGTLAAEYKREIPGWNGLRGMARAEVTHAAAYFSDPNNTPAFEAAAITQVNGRVGIQNDRWGVFAWGKNLNDAFLLTGGTQLLIVRGRGVNMPRTFGLELTFRH